MRGSGRFPEGEGAGHLLQEAAERSKDAAELLIKLMEKFSLSSASR